MAINGYKNNKIPPLLAEFSWQITLPSSNHLLEVTLLKFPSSTADRDRTVSRRSEPSSRATLIGEQPNPWNLLQLQDVTSRHRGAKPLRRYGLLEAISLLSPG